MRLGTSGVEFDQRLISLGPNAAVRFAGAAHISRQIPVLEGEKALDWQIDRLGVPPLKWDLTHRALSLAHLHSAHDGPDSIIRKSVSQFLICWF